MVKNQVQRLLYLLQGGSRQQLIQGEIPHQLVVLLNQISGLSQTSVGNETESCLVTLSMTKNIHGQRNPITPKLILDALQRSLHRQPEIDFLGCRSAVCITRHFRDCLNRPDPSVDSVLNTVDKGTAFKYLRRNQIDRRANSPRFCVAQSTLHNFMKWQVQGRNLNILLQMQKPKF